MKSTAYIIFLVLILSCETKDTYSSCDEILYNPKANWTVDTDSLKTIDEYLEYQKEFRINEGADKELIPQVKISDEKLISLSKIRTPLICCIRKFDFRTVMTIYVSEDRVETLWCKDTLTTKNNTSNYFEGKGKTIEVEDIDLISGEVFSFFKSNQGMNFLSKSYYEEFGYDIQKLEIRIVFLDKEITLLPSILNELSQGYLKFIDEKAKQKYNLGICEIEENEQKKLLIGVPLNVYLGGQKNDISNGW